MPKQAHAATYSCNRHRYALSVAVIVLGATVLFVRAFAVSLPFQFEKFLLTMRAEAAACFVLAGAALALLHVRPANPSSLRFAQVTGALLVLVGMVRLIASWLAYYEGLDEWLTRVFSGVDLAPPQHWLPWASAVNFVLLGVALAIVGLGERKVWLAQILTLVAAGTSIFAFIGFTYSIESFFPFAARFPIAFHTLFAFGLLCVGILALRPNVGIMEAISSDSLAGNVARRLLPAAVVVPWLVGALRLYGERRGLYGLEFGLALFASSNILLFTALVLWNAHWLHRSEQRFRFAVEAAPNAMVMIDNEGRIVLINSHVEKLFGFARSEILGQPVESLFPERVRDAQGIDWHRLITQPESPPLDAGNGLYGRRRDGSEFPVEISLNPIEIRGRMHVLGAVVDVTQRRRDEEQMRALNAGLEQRVRQRTAELEHLAETLRTREEEFRAVAETAADAVVSADDRGCITYFNRAAERAFGFSATEVIGQPLTLLMPERFHADHARGLHRYLTTREARVVGTTVELVGRRRDGHEFPIELSLANWTTKKGIYFTAIIRDISERKQSEDAVRQINVQLAAANAELESFSYSVSHDLRAPLRSMDGFSQALLSDYGDKLDSQAKDYLCRVRAAAQRMGGLIDDLLSLSRVTRQELQSCVVNLSEMARTTAAELQHADPHRCIEWAIADDVTAFGDSRLLRLVMQNLLGNAWKFSAGRSVARIEFGQTPDRQPPVYYIRDNGAGFDMSYAKKLFAAFQRLHSAAEFPGHGIGLATVHRIIRRHGGQVWAEGAVNQGASFYFSLPLQRTMS